MTESQSPQTPETNDEVSLKLVKVKGEAVRHISEES